MNKGQLNEKLIEATFKYDVPLVEKLINEGADVNVKYNTLDIMDTPLIIATCDGDLDMVKLLIKHGADVNAKSRYGGTALTYGVDSVIKYKGEENKELKGQWLELVEYLLKHGADPNVREKLFNSTPLGVASKKGDLETAKLLVKYGADVNARSEYGATPLIWASPYYLNMMKFLIEHGADVNAKDNGGMTALMYIALRGKNVETAKILLKHGANPHLKNKSGWDALMLSMDGDRSVHRFLKRYMENEKQSGEDFSPST